MALLIACSLARICGALCGRRGPLGGTVAGGYKQGLPRAFRIAFGQQFLRLRICLFSPNRAGEKRLARPFIDLDVDTHLQSGATVCGMMNLWHLDENFLVGGTVFRANLPRVSCLDLLL